MCSHVLLMLFSLFMSFKISHVLQASAKGDSETKRDDDVKEDYFDGADDDRIKEGNTVKVTQDAKKLQQCWNDAELGPNDQLASFCGCIGKVIEVEEDDDTFKLRWGNYDTCWIPIKACVVC